MNIIGNAIKFTETGEVDVTVEHEASGRGVNARVEVSDTGIGMSESVRCALFRPFTQADQSTTRKYGGTGLGLAISKHLVELMGGSIQVSSDLGKGSKFWFTIPLERADAKPETLEYDAHIHGKRVLVVDENAVGRGSLSQMLGALGDPIRPGNNALEALTQMREAHSAGMPFHAVVVDLELPASADWTWRASYVPTRPCPPPSLSPYRRAEGTSAKKPKNSESNIKSRNPFLAGGCWKCWKASSGNGNPRKRPAAQDWPGGTASIRAAPRLLVVDDNSGNCAVAQTMLSNLGYECDIAQQVRKRWRCSMPSLTHWS